MAASDVAGPDQETLWVQQIAAGGRSAFESLYRVYQPRLYAYTYRMLTDEGAAAEITNDVMVTVWKQAAQFEGARSESGCAPHRRPDRRAARSMHTNIRHTPGPLDGMFKGLCRVCASAWRAWFSTAPDPSEPQSRHRRRRAARWGSLSP